jgi:hypothetical protein
MPGLVKRVEADLKESGVVLALASAGALMVIGRMNQKHKAGENMMDGIESAITGMLLFGIFEHAKNAGNRKKGA